MPIVKHGEDTEVTSTSDRESDIPAWKFRDSEQNQVAEIQFLVCFNWNI